jgi:hypothetical protein
LPALLCQVDKLAFPGVSGEPAAVPERPDKRFPDGERAAGLFGSDLADGRGPSIRAIKSRWRPASRRPARWTYLETPTAATATLSAAALIAGTGPRLHRQAARHWTSAPGRDDLGPSHSLWRACQLASGGGLALPGQEPRLSIVMRHVPSFPCITAPGMFRSAVARADKILARSTGSRLTDRSHATRLLAFHQGWL